MTLARPAESALHRVLTVSTGLFRGDDYPRRLAEAAAGAQLPVTTGRTIAVVGSRGGAGRTTVTALLARIYAAMRADAVAAVDNAPECGTLGLRLGVPAAPSQEAAAARMAADPPGSLQELAGVLAVAGPANLLVTGRRSPRALAGAGCGSAGSGSAGTTAGTTAAAWTPAGPLVPQRSGSSEDSGSEGHDSERHSSEGLGSEGRSSEEPAALLSRAVSRYCPVTVVDCGPGLSAPAARRALENSHLALFVTPASAAGMADAVDYAAVWHLDPVRGSVPLLVLVVQSVARSSEDAALTASRQAARLRRVGIDAAHLGWDRHLAAGTAVNPALLARRTRLEAVLLASRALSIAVSGTSPATGTGPAGRTPA